ncbi:AtpZ/AtpI family protein [Nocardioides sp. GXZ039]|uniref:AtpZ/AtpI family protein n=1 Tax=Nocardioides sp. GXZ039 TaxID=3136018 RepID=UPI0030F3ED7E
MRRSDDTPRGDPWNAFGYIVAGVLLYGVIGWLLDRWWNTNFMVAVGILVGAGLGLYMTWARFGSFGSAASGEQPSDHRSDREPPGPNSTST